MRVTVIHNPTAGSEQPSRETIVGWFVAAGYEVEYASSKKKAYRRALEDPGDLVVVAGGDGTVAKVAKRLAGRDVPLAILPLGTSNNIAATLGVGGSPREIIDGLATAERRRLDVGTASAPWDTSRFVESAGVGLFAALLEDAERTAESRGENESGDARLASRIRGVQRVLDSHSSRFYRVEADGIDLSGRYLLVAAMNIRRIGSTLELAPGADAGDGSFDLVLLRDEDRQTLGAYLEQLADTAPERFPIVPRRVSVVSLGWNSSAGHLDDERWPKKADADGNTDREQPLVELAIVDPPLTVLVAGQ